MARAKAMGDVKKVGAEDKSVVGSRSGVTEVCVFLHTKVDNMLIVRRWGVRLGNYWRGGFLFFSKKTKMGKRDYELLEMLKFLTKKVK